MSILLAGYRKIKVKRQILTKKRRRVYNSLFSVLVAVGGNGRGTQISRGESRHTIYAKKHFQNSFYHYNLHLLYFNIHHYSIEGQELRVQLDTSRWIAVGPREERR